MMFEKREPHLIEIDSSNIQLFYDYNVEQLIYKSEIIDNISKSASDAKILELMGRLGQIAIDILEKNSDVHVDVLEDNEICLEEMKKAIAVKKLEARCSVIESSSDKILCNDETYDLIYCINTFHILKDPVKSLQEMYRVLKPNGKIIISDLRRELIEDFANYRIKELKSVANAEWMIKNFVSSWSSSYTKEETKKIITEAGIQNFTVSDDGPVALYAEIAK